MRHRKDTADWNFHGAYHVNNDVTHLPCGMSSGPTEPFGFEHR